MPLDGLSPNRQAFGRKARISMILDCPVMGIFTSGLRRELDAAWRDPQNYGIERDCNL